ncbi:PREDICTED: inositol-pentakisphosphate 2-kinase isoform X2 [Nicrophorus vespilloides]|uniref:Inositol-pentakisphosphate 2-kinase n=1 Tax=Nicrophorus vespilloides TaxID=110193 RepID=A0ABM1N4P3_NICVS|nr:PREDICTED: inositol-pentakisphosphate 2-kinase isoform X2 [Nicrophorus vespilloides]
MEKLNFECDGIKYSENWLYRGEGNAHLALSLPSLRKVLIFKKQNPQEAGDASESFLKSIAFQNKIMKHLFGIYVTRIERVEFLDDLMSFKSQLDGLRPAHRMHKTLSHNAILCQDYTCFEEGLDRFVDDDDVYAVEIKPKFGVQSEENCLFCQKQILKLNQGNIKSPTNYCPKKIFSGEFKLMLESIEDLIENPQNNFQVYKNGQLVYSENHEIIAFDSVINETFQNREDFKNAICQMLLANLEDVQESIDSSDGLPKGCVLKKILKYQSYYLTNAGNVPDNFDYVGKCLKDFNENCLDLESYKLNCPIICKVLGKIVKDCSVMLTFTKQLKKITAPKRHLIQSSNGRKILFDVKIFDLYPK